MKKLLVSIAVLSLVLINCYCDSGSEAPCNDNGITFGNCLWDGSPVTDELVENHALTTTAPDASINAKYAVLYIYMDRCTTAQFSLFFNKTEGNLKMYLHKSGDDWDDFQVNQLASSEPSVASSNVEQFSYDFDESGGYVLLIVKNDGGSQQYKVQYSSRQTITLNNNGTMTVTNIVSTNPMVTATTIWTDTSGSPILNYSEAESYCNDLDRANITTWRLPTNDELFSLYDALSCFSNPSFYIPYDGLLYWSSTPVSSYGTRYIVFYYRLYGEAIESSDESTAYTHCIAGE